MGIKTILAYLQSELSAPAVIEAAIQIARPRGAHVVGVHAVGTYPIYGEFAAGIPDDVIAQINQPARQAADALLRFFDAKLKPTGVTSEWRRPACSYAHIADVLGKEAHAADLIVCAKYSEADDDESAAGLPERLILGSGRPVLVVPEALAPAPIGERVLVAWNNTREAARAAFDAIDLIKGASYVRIVTEVAHESDRASAQAAAAQLAASLGRHGVSATPDVSIAGKGSTGDALLARLAEESCDLLVMGCYGHSRFREMIFGGVSRDILRKAAVPVLMAH